MRCPTPSGLARLFLVALVPTLCAVGSPTAQAAPKKAATAKPAASAASAPARKKQKPTSSTAKKAGKPSKATPRKTSRGHPSAASKAKAAGAAGAAAAGAAGADEAAASAPDTQLPDGTGVRLPLMLRVNPSLPDDTAALRSRLEGIAQAQGEAARGAEIDPVTQLGPGIYAFALRCTDAEQCQRLRLAIESERDWVAGLQLDERRRVPRAPERQSPAAR